jgi:hypothetical protein
MVRILRSKECRSNNSQQQQPATTASNNSQQQQPATTASNNNKRKKERMVLEYVMGANEGLSAGKIVLEGTAEWKGKLKPRWMQVAEFKRMIDNNTVLGFPKNLQLPKYATTPIIEVMGTEEDFGAVSVAFVPPSRGKTTAAYYFLRKNKKQIRGISICRPDRSQPYVVSMLMLLGLDSDNPPSGWLTCLVDALTLDNSGGDGRRSVLILDEYVSTVRDDADATLIHTLKLLLTNTSARVIVLTPSEEYANYLLTLNQLQGIVPLAGTYIDQYPKGKWKSMHWSIPTLKVAAGQDPLFTSHSTSVDSEIDDFIQGMTEEQTNALSIRDIRNELRRRLLEQPTTLEQLGVGTNLSSLLTEEEIQKSGTCAQCSIS